MIRSLGRGGLHDTGTSGTDDEEHLPIPKVPLYSGRTSKQNAETIFFAAGGTGVRSRPDLHGPADSDCVHRC